MTLQYSVAVRNARLDAVEATIGTAAILEIRTGSQPSDCAAADSGDLLASLELPSDWMAAASSGTKAKSGTWQATAEDDGTAAHFRIKDSAGTTCHAQGSVTASGGGGDIELDSVSITTGQTVAITTFTLTAGNP